MTINLEKGGTVDLEKETPGLKHVRVGMGWKASATDGTDFDLDASAFLLAPNGQCRQEEDLVFYKNKVSKDGAVIGADDNLKGSSGDTDDETIQVDLTRVDPGINRIMFTATIYHADQRKQNFGQVQKAYIRVINADNSEPILRYDLHESGGIATGIKFGELYRESGGTWNFRGIGEGVTGGLAQLVREFGLSG